MTQILDKEKVGKAIGKIAGGLYIASFKSDQGEAGFLASWVQQAGFKPPMLTLAIGKERHHLELLKQSKKFVLNVMGKENSKTMSAFFKPPEEGKSPFDGLDTFTGTSGVPILNDSVAYLECEYKGEMESGDHVIVMGEIIAGDLHHPETEASVHYREDGFKY